MKDLENFSLLQYNTFGIDVKCDRFLEYNSIEEAKEVSKIISPQKKDYLIIGSGSNLLLTSDYKGIVIHSGIKFLDRIDKYHIRCGSGYKWDDFVAYCVNNGLYGAENLSIIPGEIGASAIQNIGAYGVEAKDLITEVEAVEIKTGKIYYFSNKDCNYSYRNSKFKTIWKNKFLITAVTYKLSTKYNLILEYGNIVSSLKNKNIEKPTLSQLRQVIIEIRESKLPNPNIIGNAGSFFMNPIIDNCKFKSLVNTYGDIPHYLLDDKSIKIPAGWLIEQCGWKGKTLGNVGVYDKQALVLINKGGAIGAEVVNLYKAIKNSVKEKFGIELKPEVNII